MRRLAVFVLASLVAALALALAACGTPPDEEMAEAREALATARAARADQYAPQEYEQAVAALQRSERFVTERDHRQALSAALESRELAEAATETAGREQENARKLAAAALREVEASIATAHTFVEEATRQPPRTRPERLHVSEVRRAIVVANVAVQKAREAMSAGDYPAASQALEGVRGRLEEVIAAKPEPPPPSKPRRRR